MWQYVVQNFVTKNSEWKLPFPNCDSFFFKPIHFLKNSQHQNALNLLNNYHSYDIVYFDNTEYISGHKWTTISKKKLWHCPVYTNWIWGFRIFGQFCHMGYTLTENGKNSGKIVFSKIWLPAQTEYGGFGFLVSFAI